MNNKFTGEGSGVALSAVVLAGSKSCASLFAPSDVLLQSPRLSTKRSVRHGRSAENSGQSRLHRQ